jgi:Flp pilus assembly protein TadD
MRVFASAWFAILLCLVACGQTSPTEESSLKGDARLRVGDAADASGEQRLATTMYAQASRDAPRDASVQLRYANALVRNGNIAQARDLLINHIPLVSEPQELRRGLGSFYLLAGEPSNALVELDKVLAAQPNDMKATVDKAVALDLLNRHADAQALYRQALTRSPGDPDISNDLALSFMMEGRLSEAKDTLLSLKQTSDVAPRIAVNLGVLLAANGDLGAARAIVGNSLSQDQLVELSSAVTRSSQKPQR